MITRAALCSITLLLATGSAWAQSPTVFERARAAQLAASPQWLALGHWRKTSEGFVSEVDGPGFFLSPLGRRSPEDELRATLAAFAAPVSTGDDAENESAQCLFPARRDFLWTALAITGDEIARQPCRKLAAWKAKLDLGGATIVFASAYMGNAASMFGHMFLKLRGRQNSGDRDLLNYGVSFFARTGAREANLLLGLIGFYPGAFTLSPYHETLRDYAGLEGRDIWEYDLALSDAELERLVNHLVELEKTYFDYYFISENCSYQLLAALDAARPSLAFSRRFFWAAIPADAVRLIAREPGTLLNRNRIGTGGKPLCGTAPCPTSVRFRSRSEVELDR